ncbi:MAG: hypothetical protein AAF433_09490 [Bacteroidota bacterium]
MIIILYFLAKRGLKRFESQKGLHDRFLLSCKEQIQLTGYLLTLIGFFTAILSLGFGVSELTSIAFPIALALVTSIVGWYFGNQLRHARLPTPDIITPMQQLEENLLEFNTLLGTLKDKYELATNAFVTTATAQQEKFSLSHNNLVTALNTAKDAYTGSHEKYTAEIDRQIAGQAASLISLKKAIKKQESAHGNAQKRIEESAAFLTSAQSTSAQHLEKTTNQQLVAQEKMGNQVSKDLKKIMADYQAQGQQLIENGKTVLAEQRKSTQGIRDNMNKLLSTYTNIKKSLDQTVADLQQWPDKFNKKLLDILNKRKDGLRKKELEQIKKSEETNSALLEALKDLRDERVKNNEIQTSFLASVTNMNELLNRLNKASNGPDNT